MVFANRSRSRQARESRITGPRTAASVEQRSSERQAAASGKAAKVRPIISRNFPLCIPPYHHPCCSPNAVISTPCREFSWTILPGHRGDASHVSSTFLRRFLLSGYPGLPWKGFAPHGQALARPWARAFRPCHLLRIGQSFPLFGSEIIVIAGATVSRGRDMGLRQREALNCGAACFWKAYRSRLPRS